MAISLEMNAISTVPLKALSCNTQDETQQNIQHALAAHCLPAANTEGAKSELFTFLQSEENT